MPRKFEAQIFPLLTFVLHRLDKHLSPPTLILMLALCLPRIFADGLARFQCLQILGHAVVLFFFSGMCSSLVIRFVKMHLRDVNRDTSSF